MSNSLKVKTEKKRKEKKKGGGGGGGTKHGEMKMKSISHHLSQTFPIPIFSWQKQTIPNKQEN